MKKTIYFLAFILSFQFSFAQKEISGILPAKTIEVGNEKLNYQGAGLREKYFLDLYVGTLYLQTKNSNAASIINQDESMAITLDIVSGMITSEKMIAAIDEGFQKSTQGNTAPLEAKITSFKAAFSDEIVKGDHFVIAYLKGKGTEIYKNGKKIKRIEGDEFKKALFGIWLGKEPADEDLKAGMLGVE